MRSSTLASILALAAVGSSTPCDKRAVCNADNCARLVTGTRAGLPTTRLADCSAYQTTTVTGTPVTQTVTVPGQVVTQVSTVTTNPVYQYTTVTQTTVSVQRGSGSLSQATAAYDKRAASTAAVPAYAAASCPGTRYASACSCAGVTAATTTVPGPTTSVTVTGAPVTSEEYVAATTTVASTATVEETATATGYTCSSTVQGNGIYSFRRYSVHCGQRVTSGQVSYTSNVSSESDCLRSCNSIKYCVYAAFQFSTGACDLYYQTPTAIVDDSDWDGLILM